jgi:hypothetical protein
MTSSAEQNLQENSGQESTWSNPAKISRKVRELAHRSHQVIKAGYRDVASAREDSQATTEDPGELLDQVARLQKKVHERKLGALIPWVDALRDRVEDYLGSKGEGGSR